MLKEEFVVSENLEEKVMESVGQELEAAIIEKKISELELKQQAYQKEVDEKLNKIFQYFEL